MDATYTVDKDAFYT